MCILWTFVGGGGGYIIISHFDCDCVCSDICPAGFCSLSDRQGSVVMESVVKGVVNSLVDVENYKKKLAMQVCVNFSLF